MSVTRGQGFIHIPRASGKLYMASSEMRQLHDNAMDDRKYTPERAIRKLGVFMKMVLGIQAREAPDNMANFHYYRDLVKEDAPYYVPIMAACYDLLYADRPVDWTHKEMIIHRLNPLARFPWAIEQRNDWELRTLIYLRNRIEDMEKIKALKKLFSELEGDME